MARFTDFTFNKSQYGVTEEFKDVSAAILAIRNLLLTRPGNYPSWPDMGIDLPKYTFDFLDNVTISELKAEIETNIRKYIPAISGVVLDIRIIECNSEMAGSGICLKGHKILGIHISGSFMSDPLEVNVLYNRESDLLIVDEV